MGTSKSQRSRPSRNHAISLYSIQHLSALQPSETRSNISYISGRGHQHSKAGATATLISKDQLEWKHSSDFCIFYLIDAFFRFGTLPESIVLVQNTKGRVMNITLQCWVDPPFAPILNIKIFFSSFSPTSDFSLKYVALRSYKDHETNENAQNEHKNSLSVWPKCSHSIMLMWL